MSDYYPPPPSEPEDDFDGLPPPPRYSLMSFGDLDVYDMNVPPPPPEEQEPLFEKDEEDGLTYQHVQAANPFQAVIANLNESKIFEQGKQGRAEIVIKEKPKASSAQLVIPPLKKVSGNVPSTLLKSKKMTETKDLLSEISKRKMELDNKASKARPPPPRDDPEDDLEDYPDIESIAGSVDSSPPPPAPVQKTIQTKPKPKAEPKASPPPVQKSVKSQVKAPPAPEIKNEPMKASDYDKEVFEWMNRARTDPASLIEFMNDRIDQFLPGTKNLKTGAGTLMVTQEGQSAVEEAQDFLSGQKPLAELRWNNDIAEAAKEFVAQVGPEGIVGHQGTDGSSPEERVKKHFEQTGAAAESLKFYSLDARETVLSLIIDDGVPSRGNRKHIFGKWDFFGCNTGDHNTMETMSALKFVQSKSLGDSIVQEAISQFERTLTEPTGWVRKGQKVSIKGGIICITNTYTMADGTTTSLSNAE